MAEGTYEYECMRSELLGIDKPNEEEFEKVRAERLKHEQEEQESAEAALLEQQEDILEATGGKLDELNSILSSTQQKLNRFKQTACGSLSNIFSKGSVDTAEAPQTSTAHSTNRRNTTASGGSGGGDTDINSALGNLDEMIQQQQEADRNADVQPVIPTEKIRQAKMDIGKKMNSHLDKLDSLLHKAEHADISMSEQTKEMRKMTK